VRPPFDLAAVTLLSEPDALVTFADRNDGPPGSISPARYEGADLWLMRLVPQSGTFDIRWPATSFARTVDLAPGAPTPRLLELAPLPFADWAMLAGLEGGVPTFYLAYVDSAFPGPGVVRPANAPVPVTGAWFGIMFQDRLATAPWAWFDRLAAAPGADPEWAAWAAAFAGRRTLRLLDSIGKPLAGQPVTVTEGSVTRDLVSDTAGDLGQVVPGAHLAFAPASIALPIVALAPTSAPDIIAERADFANPAGEPAFDLPSDQDGGHLQLLDLARWFAPYLHDDPLNLAQGARFRRSSRMETLVDGEESFKRLLADIEATKLTDAQGNPLGGGAAYFLGWAFKDFPLKPGHENTRLDKIAQSVIAANGDVKILAAQFLQATPQALDSLTEEASIILLVLIAIGHPIATTTKAGGYAGGIGLALFLLIEAGGLLAFATDVASGENLGKALRKVSEQTEPDFLKKLAAVCRAVYAPHPVTMDDNPNGRDITLPDGRNLADIQNRWGVFHQKVQAIVRAGTGPDRFSAFVGGIDINDNRLDSPGHQGAAWVDPDKGEDPHASPFHDVHCRLTGAAAAEVFHVVDGRNRQVEPSLFPDPDDPPPKPNPDVLIPGPLDWGTPGRHAIQVAQTSYRSHIPHGGFDWAPDGNATTHASFVNAIKAAREHIYIEEQYMVPSDAYMQALIEASGHCKRLAIILPSFLEVYFGDTKRGQFFDQLHAHWGDRLFIGTPLRHPVLAAPGRVTSSGRMSLLEPIHPSTLQFKVGPATRVPSGKFFLWIEGELIYVSESSDTLGPDGQPAKELTVLRGGFGSQTAWSTGPRDHPAGAAVTAAAPMPIFVHSKIMMVDDLFVAIGSTNINRRGFFHDGEITAFAVPEHLRGAADNPARILRTRLWGEQLGLTPALGAALFRDPIAGFELFKRSRYGGNRVVPLTELAVPDPTLDKLPEMIEKAIPTIVLNTIKLTLQIWIETLGPDIFDRVSDPTTTLETAP